VKFIVDTQCWLWWYTSPERLSPGVQKIIADKENVVLFSAASAWEISIKYALGKLSLPTPPKEFVLRRLNEDNFTSLAIEQIHALEVSVLPMHHRDPFDRMIIAQAKVENIPVVTSDPHFQGYPVKVILATT
jgi:PIN domain nuclease of toxin-antitoxin system